MINASFLILFFATLLAGLSVLLLPSSMEAKKIKLLLPFSGAYLFAITVIHILPELFHEVEDFRFVGIWVLAGFFLQMILEYFSEGVEHGHIHIHEDHGHGHTHIPLSMFIALMLHSFLEGTLLVHPAHAAHHSSDTLMYGMVLHKIPEAFALMSVLYYSMHKKFLSVILLLVYALASPMGMVFSEVMHDTMVVSPQVFEILFALVAGNFLYISTTIFFESSPDHKFRANKLLIALSGAVLAVLAEYLLG